MINKKTDIREEICLYLFKIISSQYTKIFYANLCKLSNFLASALLSTSQPFLGLMLLPRVSATDILRDIEAKTPMLTLFAVADNRNCSIARYLSATGLEREEDGKTFKPGRPAYLS